MLLPPAYSTYELTKQHVSSFQNNKKENYHEKRIKYVHDVLFDFAAGVIATNKFPFTFWVINTYMKISFCHHFFLCYHSTMGCEFAEIYYYFVNAHYKCVEMN